MSARKIDEPIGNRIGRMTAGKTDRMIVVKTAAKTGRWTVNRIGSRTVRWIGNRIAGKIAAPIVVAAADKFCSSGPRVAGVFSCHPWP